MTVLRVPNSTVIQGPEQIANTFKSNATISQNLSLLDSGGSNVIHGNLLTLPIGNSFLYVEPLYVQASGSTGYPILQRVLVAYGDKVGYAASLDEALRNLSHPPVGASLLNNGTSVGSGGSNGGNTGSTSSTPSSSPSASPNPTQSTLPPGQAQLLSELNAALNRLQQAYKSGDLAAAGAAQADVLRLSTEYLKSASPSAKPSTSK
jgi:uncharacterized membrane protein (UPF0182 family)